MSCRVVLSAAPLRWYVAYSCCSWTRCSSRLSRSLHEVVLVRHGARHSHCMEGNTRCICRLLSSFVGMRGVFISALSGCSARWPAASASRLCVRGALAGGFRLSDRMIGSFASCLSVKAGHVCARRVGRRSSALLAGSSARWPGASASRLGMCSRGALAGGLRLSDRMIGSLAGCLSVNAGHVNARRVGRRSLALLARCSAR